MDGRPLPGFYYDPEKKKYFKILPNHLAPPGCRHSQANVRKAEIESAEAQKISVEDARRRRERITPAKVAKVHGLHGIGLGRELGQNLSRTHLADVRAGAFAAGCSLQEEYAVLGAPFSKFAWDEATNGCFLATEDQPELFSFKITGPKATQLRPLERGIGSPVSAISMSPSRVVGVTTRGGASRATISFFTLSDPVLAAGDSPPDFDIAVVCHMQEYDTVWDCCANPFRASASVDDHTYFATGSARRVSVFSSAVSAWATIYTLETESDVLAVSWLTPTTVAAGQRNGLIKLCDTRSWGHSVRLGVPRSVMALRCVDDHRLIAAAAPGSLCMYDLRMPVTTDLTAGREPGKHKRKRRGRARECTEPVVRYARYENGGSFDLGFDVNAELGVVAAGGPEPGTVRLWSLEGGDLARNCGVSSGGRQSSPMTRFGTLEFVKSGGGRDVLMGAAGECLYEFGW